MKSLEEIKILFLLGNPGDYVAESLFHGLRTLLGKNCIDFPRYDVMYKPLTDTARLNLRGNGFTLFGLLEDIPDLAGARYYWRKDLYTYDLIIIAPIWNQWERVLELSSLVDRDKIVIIDGHDSPAVFPYLSMGWRLKTCPWSYLTPVSKYKYFKRELIGEGCSYGLDRFLPQALRKWIPLPANAIPISFSIPEEKIWQGDINQKVKNFPTHIVDPEVASNVNDSFYSAPGSDKHIFFSEDEYYNDLRKSRFGITTKRGGWDCLRHYELAASGCVLCFRDLDSKPETCAPHGLNESNCIIYHSFAELQHRLKSITNKEYCELQKNSYQWIKSHTTLEAAKKFLSACSEVKI